MTTALDGLCYKPRAVTKDELQKLRESHIWKTPPSLDDVEMIFITADTMDDFCRYGVFAWTTNDHLFLIDDGSVPYIELTDTDRARIDSELKEEHKPPTVTLEDILIKDYLVKDGVGIKATFLVIDQGGHKTDIVKHFARMHRNVIMQKGSSMTSMNWRLSDNQERLVITNEKYLKSTAIYYLYSQKNKAENFLYFSPEISEESIAELRDLAPDNTSKWGDMPENWVAKTGKDHLFDCLKYAYFAREFALNTFKMKQYRFAKAPSILRIFEKAQKREESQHQNEAKRSGWFGSRSGWFKR